MKKTVFLAFLVAGALLSNSVKAEINCAGGIYFSAVIEDREREFCFSKQTLNWWSAMAWCQAHGLELAEIPDIVPANCPYTVQNCGILSLLYAKMKEIGNDGFWTRSIPPNSQDRARYAHSNTSFVRETHNFSRSDGAFHALCVARLP